MLYPVESAPEKEPSLKPETKKPPHNSDIEHQLSKAVEAGDLDRIDDLILQLGSIQPIDDSPLQRDSKTSEEVPFSRLPEFRKMIEKALEAKRAGIFYHVIIKKYCSFYELAQLVDDINSQSDALYPRLSLTDYVYQVLKVRNLLELLLSRDGAVSIMSRFNAKHSTLLLDALLANDATTVELLLKKGFTIENMLYIAESSNNPKIIATVIGATRRIEKTSSTAAINFKMLLEIALKNNLNQFLMGLLANKIINYRDLSGYIHDQNLMGASACDTLLCYASSTGSNSPFFLLYILDLMRKDGINVAEEINQPDSVHGTALMAAVVKKRPLYIKALCDAGADLFATDMSGISVFKRAPSNEILYYLIDRALNNSTDSRNASERLIMLIKTLVEDEVSEGIIYLLEKNVCDINYLEKIVTDKDIMEDRQEVSVVCMASGLTPKLLRVVLDKIKASGKNPQAEINKPDSRGGGIPLFYLIANPRTPSADKVENIKILAEYKADLFVRLSNGFSVFHLAANQEGCMAELETLCSLAMETISAKQLKKDDFLLKQPWFRDIIIGALAGNQAGPLLYLLRNKTCTCSLEAMTKVFIDFHRNECYKKGIPFKVITLTEYAKNFSDSSLFEHLNKAKPKKPELPVVQLQLVSRREQKKPKEVKRKTDVPKREKTSQGSNRNNETEFPAPKTDYLGLIKSEWSRFSISFIDVHEEGLRSVKENLQQRINHIRDEKELTTAEKIEERQDKLDKIHRILIEFHFHLQEQQIIITKLGELLDHNEINISKDEMLLWNKKLMDLNAICAANGDWLKTLEHEISTFQQRVAEARARLKQQKKDEKTTKVVLSLQDERDSSRSKRPNKPLKKLSTNSSARQHHVLKNDGAERSQLFKPDTKKRVSPALCLRRSGIFRGFLPPVETLREIKRSITRVNDCLPDLEKDQKENSNSSENVINRRLLEQIILSTMFFSSELLLKKLPVNSPPYLYFNNLRNRIVHEQWKVQRHWLSDNQITQVWEEFVAKLALLNNSSNAEMFRPESFQDGSPLDTLVHDRNTRTPREEDPEAVENEQIQLALVRSKLQEENLHKTMPHADYFNKLLIAFNAATFEECISKLPAPTYQKISSDSRFAEITRKGRDLRHNQKLQLLLIRGERELISDSAKQIEVEEEGEDSALKIL